MITLIGFPALSFQSDSARCGIINNLCLRLEDYGKASISKDLADLSISLVDKVLLPFKHVVVVDELGRELTGLGTIRQSVQVLH